MAETMTSSGMRPTTVSCTRSMSRVSVSLTTSFPNNCSDHCVAWVACRREKKCTSNAMRPAVEICACSSTCNGTGELPDVHERLLGTKYLQHVQYLGKTECKRPDRKSI
eukprot:1855343-Amphidinium_carterae.2